MTVPTLNHSIYDHLPESLPRSSQLTHLLPEIMQGVNNGWEWDFSVMWLPVEMLQGTNLGVAHALVNNLDKYFFSLVSQVPLYLGQIDVSLCLPRKKSHNDVTP